MAESHTPFPLFTLETATQKVRIAEDAWNTRDPQLVAQAYTKDSRWRNRAELLRGRAEIEAFLTRKWQRELDYRSLRKSGLSETPTTGTTTVAIGFAATVKIIGSSMPIA